MHKPENLHMRPGLDKDAYGACPLRAARRGRRNVIIVARFTSVHTGTVTIKVTSSGKPVIIDGLGIRRTGA